MPTAIGGFYVQKLSSPPPLRRLAPHVIWRQVAHGRLAAGRGAVRSAWLHGAGCGAVRGRQLWPGRRAGPGPMRTQAGPRHAPARSLLRFARRLFVHAALRLARGVGVGRRPRPASVGTCGRVGGVPGAVPHARARARAAAAERRAAADRASARPLGPCADAAAAAVGGGAGAGGRHRSGPAARPSLRDGRLGRGQRPRVRPGAPLARAARLPVTARELASARRASTGGLLLLLHTARRLGRASRRAFGRRPPIGLRCAGPAGRGFAHWLPGRGFGPWLAGRGPGLWLAGRGPGPWLTGRGLGCDSAGRGLGRV
eukprot:scaffold36328_cov142-Isochrysis_galbana.AAC.1